MAMLSLKLYACDLCKQFGPRSGLTKCQVLSVSKQFDNIMVFMKAFSEKLVFGGKISRQQKACRNIAHCVTKHYFLIFQPKYMLWVVIETVPFKHQKHMIKPIGKKAITFLRSKLCLSKSVY